MGVCIMRRYSYMIRVLVIMILTALIPALSSCGSGASSTPDAKDAGLPPVERVLRAMIEYPNEELFNPTMTYIGLGVPEMTEEERAEAQAEAEKNREKEKSAWQAAVGDCFANGMFDTFYDNWERTEILGTARILKLTTVVKSVDIIDKEEEDNVKPYQVTIEATDDTGHVDTYDTVWLVTFDSADPQLLQSIELLADGGFFCRSGCPL